MLNKTQLEEIQKEYDQAEDERGVHHYIPTLLVEIRELKQYIENLKTLDEYLQ